MKAYQQAITEWFWERQSGKLMVIMRRSKRQTYDVVGRLVNTRFSASDGEKRVGRK